MTGRMIGATAFAGDDLLRPGVTDKHFPHPLPDPDPQCDLDYIPTRRANAKSTWR
jgi:hypothetical protein